MATARRLALQPLELVPEWLTESPLSPDDFRCTTPASTIFRMSFGCASSPVRQRAASESRHTEEREDGEESILSMSDSDEEDEDSDDDESEWGEGDEERSSFLWDGKGEDEDEEESDTETIADPAPSPAPLPSASAPSPSPIATPSPTPTHTRTPSSTSNPSTPSAQSSTSTQSTPSHSTPAPTPTPAFDTRTPWYLQYDPACLPALDDQLLQAPLDAFADLCYAHAVRAPSPALCPSRSHSHSHSHSHSRSGCDSAEEKDKEGEVRREGYGYGYSWRRLSRLLSACPELSHGAAAELAFPSSSSSLSTSDSLADPVLPRAQRVCEPRRSCDPNHGEEESDTDSSEEQPASPEAQAEDDGAGAGRARVWLPGADSERAGAESPYRPYISPTSPFPTSPLAEKPLPALPLSFAPPSPLSPLSPLSPTTRPPPLYTAPPAVSQAQLAFLFASSGSAARPGESVHFFPSRSDGDGGKAKAGTKAGRKGSVGGESPMGRLRISTAAVRGRGKSLSASENGEGSPWSPMAKGSLLQRGLKGIRAGLSH
ncbi:hypothetical protein OH77DRAFT_1434507 [Trametes cingulata]|nr:hypothetical protein OH77DRAFT_1434507 [Trametes cingulata]